MVMVGFANRSCFYLIIVGLTIGLAINGTILTKKEIAIGFFRLFLWEVMINL